MTTLNDLEKRAKALADTRASVASIVQTLNDGIDALKRNHMAALKKAVNAAAEQHERLKAVIDENPQLFVKPRTVVMHGIKLGFAKGKGSVEFDDADQVVRLIEKHHPDQVDILVQVEETPVKAALAQLTAAELKKLGVTVEGTSDVVVIKPTDSAVDKTVKALMKAAIDETAEAAT